MNDVVYSIIQKIHLEGTKRLDAEYFQPEYLMLENNIKKVLSQKLETVADVNGGKRLPLEETFSDVGVPYVRVVDLYGTFIDFDHIKFIPERLHQKLKQYQIKEKDSLVTIVGNTVGLIGYNQLQLNKFNFTENCARVRAKSVLPEYLLAVLLSRIGQLQVSRERVGTAQPKLSLDRLRNFFIPIADEGLQSIISNIVKTSLELYQNSKFIYSQAEKLLVEDLGFKNLEPANELWSVVNLSEVQGVNRFDAEYFNSPCNKMLEQIIKSKSAKLGDLVEMTKGVEPGADVYQDDGKLFIRVSSISKDGLIGKTQKYISEELYDEYKSDYQPQVGEILLTKDASPGMACTVREPAEGIISSGVMRLEIKEKMNPEYLALVLNSIVGQLQAQRDAGGSIIAHWKPEQIKNLVVPILPVSAQEKIADLIVKSHQARKKAKELLDEAKLKVEEMIER